jgi:hypothetical protein
MTIHIWIMSPPLEVKDSEGQPSWDLAYSFHMESYFTFSRPWGYWLDGDEIICYFMNDIVHKYDTRKRPSFSNRRSQQWDEKIQLPMAPLGSKCLWNILGGYRPTLLSPLTFQMAPSEDNDGNRHQFEHDMLREL